MKKLILKKGKERSFVHRHPWVFSGAVQQLPDSENGEIVQVCDHEQRVLGTGFFNPKSQIICRIFEFDQTEENFHNTDYWQQKISRALALRKRVLNSSNTNTYRLLHAEGDFFPGIIADVYGEVVVLQILIKGTEKLLPLITDALRNLGFRFIYVKSKSSSQRLEDIQLEGWIGDEGPENVTVQENGILFKVDFIGGQKTGFFIDQRENRELLRSLSKGKKVLNTFCYTGGFSLYALAGGASLVHSVDISKEAVALCEENAALNGFKENHAAFAADCFDYLKQNNEMYDVIVLDPPAFAKNAKAVANASRGYKEINLKAMKSIASQGLLLTFSCSQNIDNDLFRKIVFAAAADARRNVRIIKRLEQAPCHPINIYHPESEYLKGLLLYIE